MAPQTLHKPSAYAPLMDSELAETKRDVWRFGSQANDWTKVWCHKRRSKHDSLSTLLQTVVGDEDPNATNDYRPGSSPEECRSKPLPLRTVIGQVMSTEPTADSMVQAESFELSPRE